MLNWIINGASSKLIDLEDGFELEIINECCVEHFTHIMDYTWGDKWFWTMDIDQKWVDKLFTFTNIENLKQFVDNWVNSYVSQEEAR